MVEQPAFGRRLREMRKERGLSQAAVAGDNMSTGYLSRLESGARQPTARAVAYLAERFQVDPAEFDEPSVGSVAEALALATSSDGGDEALQKLAAALEQSPAVDPTLRWQVLWLLAGAAAGRGARAEEAGLREELVRTAEELMIPELQCRARAQFARCLRSLGEIPRALEAAQEASRLAHDHKLSVQDTGTALLTLVSVEAEAGRLYDARAHADDLLALVAERTDTLRAEALWAAATVSFRQGDSTAARQRLEQAIGEFDSRQDLVLWMRLRLAAASLYLQVTPRLLDECRHRLDEAEPALALVGTPVLRQEMLTLRVHLAFEDGRYEDARAAHDELVLDELRLTYRDRIRLDMLHSRLLIQEGHTRQGTAQLRELAERAQQTSNIDLAAEIWRTLAETPTS
ncbi:helix-turn-helix domain-containing protein [Streptomyces sp. WI04-05B]|uniref:helix-turn-helix domain-containing protein n=1 Tax=Streptomyces TaxID=1883 RepID=UPI0029AA1221|nr:MULTISPECIES: helix-turn-helix transcriptional regulator [unclassified Streptomyces]MDX2542799.1 helix-turn-helix transcriptional regulator [Streptomyces sp. WI04-05B]MDX2588343.1 helix-turn-helix transcriptional regulator [Streptomyces sp. WI04-05A]MDX3747363.1 helix-turn-helix transcriptional regulator [Streptomyces sp. AK08-02]